MDRIALEALERWHARPREIYDTIKVTPITATLGAEVDGIDLSRELTNRQLDEVRKALLENMVLVFRNQKISDEDHKRFGRHFGKLHAHPLGKQRGLKDPEVLDIVASKNSKYVSGEAWHTDVTCDAEPPMGSMLLIYETPEIGTGGDTLFANMALAYDMLSAPMKNFLNGLNAVHDGALPYTQGYGYAAPEGGFPKNSHPVIARHPETGQKLLYVNSGFTSHIEGLSATESRALLDFLFRHIERTPAIQARISWRPNTLVFWDNRVTQHHAVWDYFPYSRNGKRVSIIGERPAA